MLHIRRCDELALLDVDGTAGFCGGDEQVRLAAEEGGNLQDEFDVADCIGEAGAVFGGVNVGEDGEAGLLRDGAQGRVRLRRGRGRES